jgi:mercuric ion transport protein
VNLKTERKYDGVPIIGAVAAAFAASLCCGGPLVLLIMGTTAACIPSLRFLLPYKPFFIGISLLFLGFAYYRVFGKAKEGEVENGAKMGAYCPYPRKGRANKIMLLTATVLILLLILFPYISQFFGAAGH